MGNGATWGQGGGGANLEDWLGGGGGNPKGWGALPPQFVCKTCTAGDTAAINDNR